MPMSVPARAQRRGRCRHRALIRWRIRCLARRILLTIVIIGVLLIVPSFGVAGASAAEGRCCAETGKCIGGTFLTYWEANGGLA